MSTQVLCLDERRSERVELRSELVHLRRGDARPELAPCHGLRDARDEALEPERRGLDASEELALCRLEPLPCLDACGERAERVLVLLAGRPIAQRTDLVTQRRVGPPELGQVGALRQT